MPSPLPAEPLRDRTLAWIAVRAAPDGMGAAARRDHVGPDTGQGQSGRTGTHRTDSGDFAQPRHADGIACAWGLDDAELGDAGLPHTVVVPPRHR